MLVKVAPVPGDLQVQILIMMFDSFLFDQLKNIFDVTGATELIEQVLADAHEEAVKEKLSDEEYFMKVYTENDWEKHLNH